MNLHNKRRESKPALRGSHIFLPLAFSIVSIITLSRIAPNFFDISLSLQLKIFSGR